MDLAQLDTTAASEEGAVLEIRHPTTGEILLDDAGNPVWIRLAGMDSERFQRMQRANLNRRLKMGGRRGSANVTAEELDAERIENLVACTIDWSGIVLEGEALGCSAVSARRLYKAIPWLREQAEDFQSDRANFLKVSSKS